VSYYTCLIAGINIFTVYCLLFTDVFSFFSKLEALDSLPLGLGKVYTVHYDFLLFKYTTNFREGKTLTS
jgi:hypothetical protein